MGVTRHQTRIVVPLSGQLWLYLLYERLHGRQGTRVGLCRGLEYHVVDTNLPEGAEGVDNCPDTVTYRYTGRPSSARRIRQYPVGYSLNGQLSAGGEHRLSLPPVLGPQFPKVGAAWRHGCCIEAAGMPAVPKFGDASPRPGAIATNPNGRRRLLHWARRRLHIFVLVKGALVVHHPVRPDLTDNA